MAVPGVAAYSERLKQKALTGLVPPGYRVKGQLVSVIIPTLEEQDYIEKLLISIRNQTYEPIEIVVSDSSSWESQMATREIAMKYRACLVSAPKKNVSYGRNQGAKEATGNILVFVDADCILAQDFIERLVRRLDKGAKLAHGSDCFYNDDLRNMGKGIWAAFKPVAHTTGRGIAIRQEDFWAIGGYDEACDPMTGCREDLRLGQQVLHRWGEGAISLDKGAIVVEASRRPGSAPGEGVWPERGWRKGQPLKE